jgi:hypothetical protein
MLITVDGRPLTAMALTVSCGVITVIRRLSDPAWLAQVVPSWVVG